MAVSARWALTPAIYGHLRTAPPEPNGEIGLTQAVRGLLRAGGPVWGVPLLEGEARLDIGGWETYLTGSARAAASDPEFGERVLAAVCHGHDQP
jgi:UTP--glucose-1-phosphate uridylyltransferase